MTDSSEKSIWCVTLVSVGETIPLGVVVVLGSGKTEELLAAAAPEARLAPWLRGQARYSMRKSVATILPEWHGTALHSSGYAG
jgi:hypothetical protein